MHGLVNRSLQVFLAETYGAGFWQELADAAGAPASGFEAMLLYDDAVTDRLLAAASAALDRPADAVLEDLGSFLAMRDPMRRLLRFGGADFDGFLQSLDELPDRARLAVDGLDLPDIDLRPRGQGLVVRCRDGHAGYVPALAGAIRAMADDYGALAMVDVPGADEPGCITIQPLAAGHSAGRAFALAAPGAA